MSVAFLFFLLETDVFWKNIYGLASVTVGAVSGIWIAHINTSSKRDKTITKNIKTISELQADIDTLTSQFESLKKAFSIVFDAYERELKDYPDKISMLKDLKKTFDL